MRPRLLPEFPVYASAWIDGQEQVTAGIADAIAPDADRTPAAVVGRRSNAAPPPGVIEHYRGRVRAQMEMTGAKRGLIVFATTGAVAPAEQGAAEEAA